jgi:hypothetical protein
MTSTTDVTYVGILMTTKMFSEKKKIEDPDNQMWFLTHKYYVQVSEARTFSWKQCVWYCFSLFQWDGDTQKTIQWIISA